ncbi:MAG: NAD-binding protein [Myxococcota bacterium]|nr:NAD-binding protein [Myxococcota bacterium]
MEAQRQAIIVGAGKIGKQLVEVLPQNWSISLIDHSEEKLLSFEEYPNVQTICGDASSRLVLQKADPKSTSAIFLTALDDELNKECGRIAKEFFHVEEVVCILQNPTEKGDLDENDVIDISKILALHMSNQVAATFKGVGIGLGKGEIRQITILSSSAAVGMPLKELKPQSWLVAAIYREQKLIVPHGDNILKAKDRILLVGDPEILDSEEQFIRGGRILFPTQYGSNIGYIELEEQEKKEVNWFVENTLASQSVQLKAQDFDLSSKKDTQITQTVNTEKVGCLVLKPSPIPWASRVGLTRSKQNQLLLASRVPVFVPRGSIPFKKILLAVGTQEHATTVAAIAVDLCRQFEATLTSLSVITPHSDEKEADDIEKIPKQISQIARSNGIEIERIVDKGNPIHKIREHAAQYDLLILGYSRSSRNTIFKPDISMHLLHDTPCSTLFVPWDAARR